MRMPKKILNLLKEKGGYIVLVNTTLTQAELDCAKESGHFFTDEDSYGYAWMQGSVNHINDLTAYQIKIGYRNDGIDPVGMLGLFGEAGEVLEEWAAQFNKNDQHVAFNVAIDAAKAIDAIKKKLRDAFNVYPNMRAEAKKQAERVDLKKFDEELADALYYLNLLALNRGKSLEHFAKMSLEKVMARSQKTTNEKPTT